MSTIRRSQQVAASERKISTKVQGLFPRHFQESDTELIPLLQAYYRWAEQDNEFQKDTYSFTDNLTSTRAEPEFLELLADEFLANIPGTAQVDRSFLIQHVLDLYRAKGTEEGVKLLFRILFKTEPTIDLPRERILRASDGEWVVNSYMFVEYLGNDVTDLEGYQVFGEESGAYAMVEEAVQFAAGNYNSYRLLISGVIGTFLPDEIVQTNVGTLRKARTLGTIEKYTIIDGGSGYVPGQTLTVTAGDGLDFQVEVKEVRTPIIKNLAGEWIEDVGHPDFGKILSLNILNSGVGFTAVAPVCSDPDAALNILFTIGGAHFAEGTWISERGKLDSSMVLEDGEVYQEFSYVVRSDVSLKSYRDVLKDVVHPAGWRFGGIFQIGTPENIENGPVLFHLHQGLSQEFDAPPNDLGWVPPVDQDSPWVKAWREVDSAPNPDWSPSSKRFIEPSLQIETGPKKSDALAFKLPFPDPFNPTTDLWASNNDLTQNLGDLWDEVIQPYEFVQIGAAYVFGVDLFQYHDCFTSLRLNILSGVGLRRFDRQIFTMEQWLAIQDVPIEHWFSFLIGNLKENPYRQYHVYPAHRIHRIIVCPGGDILWAPGDENPLFIDDIETMLCVGAG